MDVTATAILMVTGTPQLCGVVREVNAPPRVALGAGTSSV